MPTKKKPAAKAAARKPAAKKSAPTIKARRAGRAARAAKATGERVTVAAERVLRLRLPIIYPQTGGGDLG